MLTDTVRTLTVPIRLRWSDLDAYGHVNNTAVLRLFEEARVEAFWAADASPEATVYETAVLRSRPGEGTLTVIAHQEIDYLASIPYLRDPVRVVMWFSHMGGASLDICYEVRSPAADPADTLYAKALTTVVLVDAETQRPRRMTEEERATWKPYLGEPLSFSRRG